MAKKSLGFSIAHILSNSNNEQTFYGNIHNCEVINIEKTKTSNYNEKKCLNEEKKINIIRPIPQWPRIEVESRIGLESKIELDSRLKNFQKLKNGQISFESKRENSKNDMNKSKKRGAGWARAVFSNLQRKGLERRFQLQKYITKPDRRLLASTLGLSDAQVKVWFQNRRMKWRQANRIKSEFMIADSTSCINEDST